MKYFLLFLVLTLPKPQQKTTLEPQLSLACDKAPSPLYKCGALLDQANRGTMLVKNYTLAVLNNLCDRATLILCPLHFSRFDYTGKTAIKTVIRNVNISDKCPSQAFYKYELKRNSKQKYKRNPRKKNFVYTHCDLHHILYPSASSRPQQQNFKPAVEKYKWEQFSCPYL